MARHAAHGVRVPAAKVALSTASVYPQPVSVAFELASRLGYDGVELMVFTDPVSQDIDAVRRLSDDHGVPILAVHAPCLLVTQRVWGSDPWAKLERARAAAELLGASTVVVHPPFRWQREYVRSFVEGIARMGSETDVKFAVENMYPWRARSREIQAYAPAWDPTDSDFTDITLDLSHTAVSGTDAVAMAQRARRPARSCAPRRRVRLRQGRAPGARARRPAVRRGPRPAGGGRLRRHGRAGGVDPPDLDRGGTRGRPRRGVGLRPAPPRPPSRDAGSGQRRQRDRGARPRRGARWAAGPRRAEPVRGTRNRHRAARTVGLRQEHADARDRRRPGRRATARSRFSALRPATGRCGAGSGTSPRRPRSTATSASVRTCRYFAAVIGAPSSDVERVVAGVGLAEQSDVVVSRLSGGQRARVSLATALLGRPELLVLDEPTVGLDPVLRRDLWQVFADLAADGVTLLDLQPRDGRGGALPTPAAHARRRDPRRRLPRGAAGGDRHRRTSRAHSSRWSREAPA